MKSQMRSTMWMLFLVMGFVCFSGCKKKISAADRCGDGFLDPGEECDRDIMPASTCMELGYYDQQVQLTCKSDCTYDLSVCLAGRCGDGIIQGIHKEDCDGDNLAGVTCASLGLGGGTLRCNPYCRYDVSMCETTAQCGDGTVAFPFELCEPTDLRGESCQTRGYYEGTLTCAEDCRDFDESGCSQRCGDQDVQTIHGEVCDGTNLDGQTCESLGYRPGQLGCNALCQFDFSGCDGYCGDGDIQGAWEQCDGANLDGKTCESIGYHPGTLGCNATCELVVSGCGGYCGDGILQTDHEVCEGADLNGQTCMSLTGLVFGELLCGSDCQFVNNCLAVVAISAGGEYSCAVLENGTARCWGQNSSGQLGNGTTTSSPTPVMVAAADVVAISAGNEHTCAMLQNGTARCWGRNQFGQLGDNSTTNRSSPVAVSGLTGVVTISAGNEHTCAVLQNGTARCWGRNQYGQLGIGTASYDLVLSPAAVSGLSTVEGISTGGFHACALLGNGTVRCWGYNNGGQLGNGTMSTEPTPSPVAVSGLTNAATISAGWHHTCAVLWDGTARCWGINTYGRLGDGSTTHRSTPAQVSGLTNAASIAAGLLHTCAVLGDGTVRCWGYNNWGQLGNGTTSTGSNTAPVIVTGLTNAASITAGGYHSCSVLGTGTARTWGRNEVGQLGDGSTNSSSVPVMVLP